MMRAPLGSLVGATLVGLLVGALPACGGGAAGSEPPAAPSAAPATSQASDGAAKAPEKTDKPNAAVTAQEVTGVGFVMGLPSPAEWSDIPASAGQSKAAHSYIGKSTATPGVMYTVTSVKLDELEKEARDAGPEAFLTSYAAGVVKPMQCTKEELKVQHAPAKEAEKIGFKEVYGFIFKCSAKDRAGVGFGYVGKNYWYAQFAAGTQETMNATPLAKLKPFLDFHER